LLGGSNRHYILVDEPFLVPLGHSLKPAPVTCLHRAEMNLLVVGADEPIVKDAEAGHKHSAPVRPGHGEGGGGAFSVPESHQHVMPILDCLRKLKVEIVKPVLADHEALGVEQLRVAPDEGEHVVAAFIRLYQLIPLGVGPEPGFKIRGPFVDSIIQFEDDPVGNGLFRAARIDCPVVLNDVRQIA